jgi:hypothetical protein
LFIQLIDFLLEFSDLVLVEVSVDERASCSSPAHPAFVFLKVTVLGLRQKETLATWVPKLASWAPTSTLPVAA